MDTAIMFTPGQILAWCAAIMTISGAASVIANLITKALSPNKAQNARLDAIEKRLETHDTLFANDLKRFQDIDEGNKVTQTALLALLSHALDGNDVQSLKDAKKDLEKYLIGR